jgi:hypothetical protein
MRPRHPDRPRPVEGGPDDLYRDSSAGPGLALPGDERAEVETTLSGLEASWGVEIARQQGLAAPTSLGFQEQSPENAKRVTTDSVG